ncbi:MAG: carbohydrate ABC transporter substrate-binding protein, partial [Clostridia bacterium]|nr:carbohydrate ABC transporter substrate-binding protein [Clostridia bacterium]
MKNLKKVLAVLLAMIMVIGLAACTSGGGEDSSSETGSVYWLNFKPELDETAQQLAKMYTEKTGVAVKVVTAASGTYG